MKVVVVWGPSVDVGRGRAIGTGSWGAGTRTTSTMLRGSIRSPTFLSEQPRTLQPGIDRGAGCRRRQGTTTHSRFEVRASRAGTVFI